MRVLLLRTGHRRRPQFRLKCGQVEIEDEEQFQEL
jgi:hypothetical protein